MARISEIHYSNAHANATGVGEFFEVALSPGEDPADFFVSTYNQNGSVFLDISLADPGITATFDASTGETIYLINGATYGFLLTDPNSGSNSNNEAVALTDVSGGSNVVIDFYDVGGGTTNITATNGAAAGATSTNLAGDFGFSIQFNQPNPTTPVFNSTTPSTSGVVCFAKGTPILTHQGYVPIEDLREGDLIHTMDNGLHPIRWIGSRTVSGTGRFAPVRLSRGVFHAASDILVSPAHRVLLNHVQAQLLFDTREVLLPANRLTDLPGIDRAPCPEVTYFHMMFDTHQIVFADGLRSESFFPGDQAITALESESRDEVLSLFPELAMDLENYGTPARAVLRGFEAKALIGQIQA